MEILGEKKPCSLDGFELNMEERGRNGYPLMGSESIRDDIAQRDSMTKSLQSIFNMESDSVVSSSSTLLEERSSFSSTSVIKDGKNIVRSLQGTSMVNSLGKDSMGMNYSKNPRNIRKKSNSLPIIPVFRPKDLRFEKHPDCKLVSSDELAKLMQDEKNRVDIISIDARTFMDYSKGHIMDALHLCLPSTLLKRKNFDLRRLVDNITPARREQISSYLLDGNDGKPFSVLIYDAVSNHTNSSMSLPCFGISSKILDAVSPNSRYDVYVLSDGFDKFNEKYPHLVEGSVSPINIDTTSNTTAPQPWMGEKMQLHVGASCANSPGHNHTHSKSCSGISIDKTPAFDQPKSFGDSPMSTSSPSSALFGLQMPTHLTRDFSTFKLPQIEHEIDDLNNYVKAVELSESRRSSCNHSIGAFQEFKFPPSTPNDCCSSPVSRLSNTSSFSGASKLNFQLNYEDLLANSDSSTVDQVVPFWFHELMKVSKMEFIRKFQKLELLERKRLRKILRPSSQYTIHNQSLVSEAEEEDEQEENDEQGQAITVSSGVEFGSKNRYKDIFPYEHSRVVLRRSSITSCTTSLSNQRVTDTRSDDDKIKNESSIWDTYINANYLTNPFLNLKKPGIRQVRYIATQAPLRDTVADFYTCIINNRVPLVLSLTSEYENGVEKCYNFWSSGKYENYEVELLDEYSTLTGKISTLSYDTSGRSFDSRIVDALKAGGKSSSNFESSRDKISTDLNYRKSLSLGTSGLHSNIASKFNSYSDRTSDMVNEDQDPDEIIIRRIRLIYNGGNSTYELLQLQVKNWPDLGTPLKPDEVLTMLNIKDLILDGLYEKNAFCPNSEPTVLVHCSAGCGRTGTICTVDSILSTFLKETSNDDTFCMAPCSSPCSQTFNLSSTPTSAETSNATSGTSFDPVFTIINQFRKQRISMVQNINQFLFVYDCLLGYLNLKLKKSSRDEKLDEWDEMTQKHSNIDIISNFLMCKRTRCEQQ